ncbi:MAG: zinc-binding dehydrogenase [Chloroflexi bacterium]|nr:zinc-binding dehydrogenase [Chloroflexota bacterium]
MKAAYVKQFGSEDAFIYGDLPDPQIGPKHVLVRVKAAGINRGDLFRREGTYPGAAPSFPFVPGWEVAGTIEAVGSEVKDRLVGQRVVATLAQGGYAELVAVHRAGTIPIPASLSFEEAASIPMVFLTSWFALVKVARIEAGETALIQSGGSGVGMAGIQIARHLGAKVITTAGTDEKTARALALGAEVAVNYERHDFLPEAMRCTNNAGVNVVLESVGGAVLTKSIAALAPLGRLVIVGNSSRSAEKPDLAALAAKNASFNQFSLGRQMGYGGVIPELEKILDLCARGKMKTVVDRVFPLPETAAAHRYLADRKNFGKVILRP